MLVNTSLLFLFCSWLFMINVIISSQQQIISKSVNGSDSFTLLTNQPSDKTLLSHDESLTVNDENSKPTNNSYMGKFGPIKVQLLQQLNPISVFKPLQEKIDKVKETLLSSTNNAQFWNTDNIWEKVHQSGHQFLTGINNAIFGIVHPQQQDYPFPYRRKDGTN